MACRVKLPKTFLAVNLSDAFSFQEKERQNPEADDALEMKSVGHRTSRTPAAADQEEVVPVELLSRPPEATAANPSTAAPRQERRH